MNEVERKRLKKTTTVYLGLHKSFFFSSVFLCDRCLVSRLARGDFYIVIVDIKSCKLYHDVIDQIRLIAFAHFTVNGET